MSASAYLRMALRWWWLLIAAAVIGGTAGYSASGFMTPTYESSATLLVSPPRAPEVPVDRNSLEASTILTSTLSQMVTVRPVLERAVTEGGLDVSAGGLAQNLTVASPSDGQLIEITTTSDNAGRAQRMAQAVANAFITAPEVERVGGAGAVTILSAAQLPGGPVSPQPRVNAILGAILAIAVTGAVLVAFEYADDRVRVTAEIERVTNLPVIARFRRFRPRGNAPKQVLIALRRGSPLGEEYRSARTNVLASMNAGDGGRDPHQVVLVTSPGRGEGKSTVATGLAAAFGMAGHRVLLIDANLRAPTLHLLSEVQNEQGLSELLTDPESELKDFVQPGLGLNVDILTGGVTPPNPSELLGSGRLGSILDEAREDYNVVIVDSPGLLTVTDALVLAEAVDSVVLVARYARTHEGDLVSAANQLVATRHEIAGIVLNASRGPERRSPGGWRVIAPMGQRIARATSFRGAPEEPEPEAAGAASRGDGQTAGGGPRRRPRRPA